MEGNLQDPTDKNDFMMNHTGASLGWLEEGDCSEGSFEFDDVSIFLLNVSFLGKAQQPLDGGLFLSLNKGLDSSYPRPSPGGETETGHFDPIPMDICPPRTFECTAGFVSSPFLLLYIHSTSQPP